MAQYRYLLYVVSGCLISLATYGLLEAIKMKSISFGGFHALVIFLSVFLLTYGSSYCLRRINKLNYLYLIGVPLIIISLILGGLPDLIAVVYFVISSIALGILIIQALKIQNNQFNNVDLFLIGAGCYGILIQFLAYFPINTIFTYFTIFLLPIILVIIKRKNEVRKVFKKLEGVGKRDELLLILVVSLALTHYVYSFLPEFGYDALAFHLFVASTMKFQASWGFNPELYSWALMPMLGDWLYSCVYIIGGETSARILNVVFILCITNVGCRLARWMGGNENASHWTAILFLSSPLAFAESGSLFVESIWGTFILISILFFLKSSNDDNDVDKIKIGFLFTAFALSTKALTFIWIPILLILVGLKIKSINRCNILKTIGVGVGILIALGLVPYISSYLISGNPVFPFFNGIFKSRFYPEANFDNPLFKTVFSWDFLYQITFNSRKYLEASAGAPGFQYLLILPISSILIILQKNYRGMLIFIIAILMIWITFQTQSYLRYIFPAFILLSAIAGISVANIGFGIIERRVIIGIAVISFVMNLALITAAGWNYRNMPYSAFFSEEARNRYIEKQVPIRRAIGFINSVNSYNTPVIFLSEPYGAGLMADYLVPNWYNAKFQSEINQIRSAKNFIDLMNKYDSRYLILRDQWGDAKIRELIITTTTEIAKFNSITVRQLPFEGLSP